MKEAVKKEILYDLEKAWNILRQKEAGDVEQLRVLSDHGIEDVAAQKDIDLITVTVLLYSLYKVALCLGEKEYVLLQKQLQATIQSLQTGRLGRYNANMKELYDIVRQCHGQVREHLQDVMDAARIKKGTVLLQKGLSIGQAAGLMGISNWDLQSYAAKTTALDHHPEKIPAQQRLQAALRLFQSKNKALFFDTGPIITLVLSRVEWILPLLKKRFGGTFYITPAVRHELIERPLATKRFEFEALQSLKLLRDGVLELYEEVPAKMVKELDTLANTSFSLQGKNMDILQTGELEAVASAAKSGSPVVIDERTLRLCMENPSSVQSLLEHRFDKPLQSVPARLGKFQQALKWVTVIRSLELVAVAFSLGLMDGYIPPQKDGRKILLDSILWATKVNGAAVSEEEIEDVKRYLLDGKLQ